MAYKMGSGLRWLKDEESGQGIIEYGVILAAVSIAAVLLVSSIGDNVKVRAEYAAGRITGI